MKHPVIFLDDGGVMSDNNVRAPQWQRLVSEYFVPILGGTPEAWAAANHEVIGGFFRPGAWSERLQAAANYESFEYAYLRDWIMGMCRLVGVKCPPEEDAIALARRASESIPPKIKADIPGSVDAVRLLKRRGYTLHTASGGSSSDLRGYLDAMGVLNLFTRLYGPDLVDALKVSPKFYRRIFADSGTVPSDALVVDDSPEALEWAAEVGARTVLVSPNATGPRAETVTIHSLSELPDLIRDL
jgi:FMN phosphatase YigB (HAD superfamily)